MKMFYFLLFTVFNALSVLAQQDAMYSQYRFNTLAINPAYAGSRDRLSTTAMLRSQWAGVEGAPETKTLSFDMPIRNRKLGIGMQFFNEKVGVSNLSGGFISYAYRIFMENSTLAFGLQAGASHFKADLTSVDLGDQIQDQTFLQNTNEVYLNFGTGAYYNSRNFYLGLSMPHLFKNTLNNIDVSAITNGEIKRQYLHVFIASGYVVELDKDFKIVPSFLFKGIQGAPVQIDFNANLWIKDSFSIGAQYRSSSSIAAMMEVQISPQIRVGYSYDRSLTKLANFNSASHEIMLRYEFGFEKEVLSPRYF